MALAGRNNQEAGMIPRRAQRRDANEKAIIDALKKLGISVMQGTDVDLILGHSGKTFLVELKDKEKLFLKDGVTFRKGAIKPSQVEIMRTWRGHYSVCWELDQILDQIGYRKCSTQ